LGSAYAFKRQACTRQKRLPLSRRGNGVTLGLTGIPQDWTMNLLADIQAAAVDPKHSLSHMLRQCQILAFRLRLEPFKTWVRQELNGGRGRHRNGRRPILGPPVSA
jgi:hypothetical protein